MSLHYICRQYEQIVFIVQRTFDITTVNFRLAHLMPQIMIQWMCTTVMYFLMERFLRPPIAILDQMRFHCC